MSQVLYSGDIVAGSLLVNESRKVADLMLRFSDEQTFYNEMVGNNLLQKRSLASTRRQGKLIRKRLLSLHRDFWLLVRDGSCGPVVHALLAAAIAYDHLLGDFIQHVVGLKLKTFQKEIAYRDWDIFFEECQLREPAIANWAESTSKKVRQVVFRILAEAKITDSTRNRNLLPFALAPEVKELLIRHNERYVLDCLEAIQ